MANFIDEMNAIYDKEKNEKILMEEESKNREYQKLEEIKDLILNKFVKRFKETILQYKYLYIEENGKKHFKGMILIDNYYDSSDYSPDSSGYYIVIRLFDVKEKNTIFGNKCKFENSKNNSRGVRLTNLNYLHIKDTLYGKYLHDFSFYSGDGKDLCDKLKKEIPSIVFEKKNRNSTGHVIGFDIYI